MGENKLLDDDSSDEEESGDESDDESGSDNDSDSESGSDDESDSGSGSEDDDSDDESGSGSDTDDSPSTKKNKKKNNNKDDEKKDEEDNGSNAIYKIQQISSKLSWLLDDLHKTFKPKSVPKIDPKNVFPYQYTSIPQHSPQSKHYHDDTNREHQIHIKSHHKSPISSPIRHGDSVDRGAGGNYIFPSYAAPPSKNEIKKLYKNYSDNERVKIAENQQKERERKKKRTWGDNVWQSNNFSDKFMSASKQRQNQKMSSNSKRKLFGSNKGNIGSDNFDDIPTPHTFDELYKHYDEQKRLIQEKQNKMKRMKNKLYWFRKNSSKNVKISEKKPLMKQRNNNHNNYKKEQLFPSKSLKETEHNLLNKAAQILLGNGNNGSKGSTNEYDAVSPDSPDSLQQKILHIASDDDDEDENRMPMFV